jgi:transposase
LELESGPSLGRTDEASEIYGRAIIGILRENEAGAKTGELARKHGVSERTIYAWKAKFGGMSVSEAQRLRTVEV